MQSGKIAIKYQHVPLPGIQFLQGIPAIVNSFCLHAFHGESHPYHISEIGVVFDNQNLHPSSSLRETMRTP